MPSEMPKVVKLTQSIVDVVSSRGRARWKPGFIGFELSHENLHMVQMEHCEDEQRIRAAVSVPYRGGRQAVLDSAKSLRKLVGAGLQRKPFVGKKIVTCVPTEQLKLMMINYHCEDSGSESEILLKTALERVGGNVDDWVVDYVPIRSRANTESERVALVAMTLKADQQQFLNKLSKAGLFVEALEIGPVAIRRLVCSVPTEQQYANNMVINVGRSSSYVTIFSGDRLLLDRSIRFGEQQAVNNIIRQLDVDERGAREMLYEYGLGNASAVANSDVAGVAGEISSTLTEVLTPLFLDLQGEIRKALIYMASQSRGASIDRVFLLGSMARWPGSETVLGQIFNLPVEILNPFAAFEARSNAAVLRNLDPIAGIATATGCALRGL